MLVLTTALPVALATVYAGDPYNLQATLIITVVIQFIFFILAASLRTDKFTDLAYGSTFALLALLLLLEFNHTQFPYQVLIAACVCVWGIRLSAFLFLRIQKIGKDNRFDEMRAKPMRFLGFWALQALAIWVIMFPATIALSSADNPGLTAVAIVGFITWLTGFLIEVIADRQKSIFKRDPNNAGTWIESGLWRYSRHPNYFGEILCWVGVFLMCVPVLHGWQWIAVISPIFITVLLLYISGVPLLEAKYEERYAGNADYAAYKRRTSKIIPLPSKR